MPKPLPKHPTAHSHGQEKDSAHLSSQPLPDPVVAAVPGSTVVAWIDKDNWVNGKPDKRVARYFLDIRVRGLPNHEIHGASSANIEALGNAFLDLAKSMRNP